MTVFCYKVGEKTPVVMHEIKCLAASETDVKYCDKAKEVGLTEKFPDALKCEDKLFTVTGMSNDGSMYTAYDVVSFEGD